MSRRLALVCAAAIILLTPFGEGGRAPWALFVLHTLCLACVALASTGPAPPWPRPGALLTDTLLRPVLLAGAGLALALVSALSTSYPLAAGLRACDLVVPCALFVAAARMASEQRDLGALRAVVVASTSLQALLALVRSIHAGAMEAGTSFLNPNHLASFLNVGLFLTLVPLFGRTARPVRVVQGALAALHFVALLTLESRGAFAALFIAAAIFGFLRCRALPWRARTVAAGLLLACALAAAFVLGARFSRASDPYRYTRVSIWNASAAMIAERPLLGFGPGMFPYVAARFNFPAGIGPVRYGRTFQDAHSAYLTLAAEAGIPAAALIAAALFIATFMFLRARYEEEEIFAIGLALLALLLHGCVEDLSARPALTIVPAILAGGAIAALRRRRSQVAAAFPEPDDRADSRLSPRPARWVGAALVVYLFFLGILLPYRADREAVLALSLTGGGGLPHMERAALLNPLHPEYRNDLAMAILNSGPLTPEGYARASVLLLEARRLKPIDYRFPLHLARLEARFAGPMFDDRTAMERALALYREAVHQTPLDPRPRLELAGLLVEVKRPAEALDNLREALDLEPNFLRARILEASILLDTGGRVAARASLHLADQTLGSLLGYQPDSGYARDITMDARVERERLTAVLARTGPRSASE